MDFPLRSWVEKIVYGVETHLSSSKVKVSGLVVSLAYSLLVYEMTHHYWLPWFLEVPVV